MSPAGSSANENSAREERQQEIVAELARLIAEIKPERKNRVRPDARLQSDIGLDSVSIIDLVIAAEDAFAVEIPDSETGDLMDATLVDLAQRVQELSSG